MTNYFVPFSQDLIMASQKSTLSKPGRATQNTRGAKQNSSRDIRQSLAAVRPMFLSSKTSNRSVAIDGVGLSEQSACENFAIAWLGLMFEDQIAPYVSANVRIDTLKDSYQKLMQLYEKYYISDMHHSHTDSLLLQSQGLRELGVVEQPSSGKGFLDEVKVELGYEMRQPHSAALLHSFNYIKADGTKGGHTIGYFRKIQQIDGEPRPVDEYVVVFDPSLGEACIRAEELPKAFSNLFSRYGAELTQSVLRRIDVDSSKKSDRLWH